MAEAKRDGNYVTTLLAVSNADGTTPVTLYADPTTHRLLVSATAGNLGDLSDVTFTSEAQGDILYRNATEWVNLAAGTSGRFLKTQGAAANPIWADVTASPAGSDTQVQFNDGGALGGDAGLVYNKTTDVLSIAGSLELGHATDTTLSRSAAGVLAVEGVVIPSISSTNTLTNKTIALGSNTVSGTKAEFDTAVTDDNFAYLATAQTFTALQTHSLAGAGIRGVNTTDGASVQVALFEGDRATMAANDEAYVSLKLSDAAGNQDEFARITWRGTDVTSTSEDGRLQFGVITAGTLADELYLTATELSPAANDGIALGTTALGFADLHLASGGTINFANGDAVITHSAGILTVSTGDLRVTTAGTNTASVVTVGGTQTLTNKTLTSPVIAVIGSNTLTLGTGTFTTLTFDAGASDPVITAASGILTVTTGDLRVTSANVGTNADSVPTLSSTSTLTNKTLTSPTLTTPSAFTTGGTITLAENTSIALDPAGSADGKYTGITIAGTAGAALAFGDLCYLAAADSRWELTDADAVGTSGTVLLGMCVLAAAADGNATTLLLMGQIRADAKFPALTISAPVYVGETAGAIQVAIPTGADNVIRVVGFALTADEMYFCPSQDHQTTVA